LSKNFGFFLGALPLFRVLVGFVGAGAAGFPFAIISPYIS
jgi:hypothetical protein